MHVRVDPQDLLESSPWCAAPAQTNAHISDSFRSGTTHTFRKSRSRSFSPSTPSARFFTSAPLTLQVQQKHLPCIPMCDANSLDIGLSPRNARIQGITSTNSFDSTSHTRIPFSQAALEEHCKCPRPLPSISYELTVIASRPPPSFPVVTLW